MINPRIVLLPIMAVFELLLLALCFLMGAFRIKADWVIAINEWSECLPDIDWYTKTKVGDKS